MTKKQAQFKLEYWCAECGIQAVTLDGRTIVPHMSDCAFAIALYARHPSLNRRVI